MMKEPTHTPKKHSGTHSRDGTNKTSGPYLDTTLHMSTKWTLTHSHHSPSSTDPIFGTNGITTTSFGTAFEDANGMAITPDNKVVCVGMSAQTNNDFAIARYFLGPIIDHVDEWDMQGLAYPNPTTGLLTLPAGMLDEEWFLRDALGRPVDCAVQRFGARTELDLSGLTEGVYLLTGTTASGRFSERVLLQR